ncbi:MAG: NAD(P) transhydrogenase subunit alpha [Myxococcota bacterium]
MKTYIPKETAPGETRVAATPETVKQMVKAGLSVFIDPGAGAGAFIPDQAYVEAGASLVDVAAASHEDDAVARAARETTTEAETSGTPSSPSPSSDPPRSALPPSAMWSSADLVLKVAPPSASEAEAMKEGAAVVGFLAPYEQRDLVRTLRDRRVSSFSMELVPRITRAQKMDALSSQASIAGYKAVLLAAAELPKYFPLLMTAAGTIKPAKVVVMGAGVAGLQAIATAKRLGAVVHASDIRPSVKEQIESLGGKFIPLPEREESTEGEGGYAKQVSDAFLAEQKRIVRTFLTAADVVICTALVPGKRAPMLVPAEAVEEMKPGSVIVDMAVAQGGNCALSVEGKSVREHGVLIIGEPNLPGTMPADASLVYARNVWALVDHLVTDAALAVELDDEITAGCTLTHAGSVHHAPTAAAIGDTPPTNREVA